MTRQTSNLAIACVLAASAFACSDASGPGNQILPELKHDPILFVHGFAGNGGNWQDVKSRFAADGWQDFELYSSSVLERVREIGPNPSAAAGTASSGSFRS